MCSSWSPNVIWHYMSVVQWNNESFKGEGLYNIAIPCDSSQELFYVREVVIHLFYYIELFDPY